MARIWIRLLLSALFAFSLVMQTGCSDDVDYGFGSGNKIDWRLPPKCIPLPIGSAKVRTQSELMIFGADKSIMIVRMTSFCLSPDEKISAAPKPGRKQICKFEDVDITFPDNVPTCKVAQVAFENSPFQ